MPDKYDLVCFLPTGITFHLQVQCMFPYRCQICRDGFYLGHPVIFAHQHIMGPMQYILYATIRDNNLGRLFNISQSADVAAYFQA